MFNFFEDQEADTGEEMELDVIAICCDFNEATLEEFNNDYDRTYEDMDELINDVNSETMVIPVSDESFIYLQF